MPKTQEFEIGTRMTNEHGAWVTLRYDANGGIYYSGVYYAEAYAPDFAEGITSTELTSHHNRKNVERRMRQWLAGR